MMTVIRECGQEMLRFSIMVSGETLGTLGKAGMLGCRDTPGMQTRGFQFAFLGAVMYCFICCALLGHSEGKQRPDC